MGPPPCRGVHLRCSRGSLRGGALWLTAETRGPTRGHRPVGPGMEHPGGTVPRGLRPVPGRAEATVDQNSPGGSPSRGVGLGAVREGRWRAPLGQGRRVRRYTRVARGHTQTNGPCLPPQRVTGGPRSRPDGRRGERGRRDRRAPGRRNCRGRPRRPASAASAGGGEGQGRPSPMAGGGWSRRPQADPRVPLRAGVEDRRPPCARTRRRRTRR